MDGRDDAVLAEVGLAEVGLAEVGLAEVGLAERIPNRGARVRAITMAEAVAITECRKQQRGRGNRPGTMKGRPDAGPAKPATSASHNLKQLLNVR